MQGTDDSDERASRRRVEVTRGIIVIVLAIAVGAFVVTQGLGDGDAESAAGSDVAAVGAEGAASSGTDESAGGDPADDPSDGIGGATAESDPSADTTAESAPASPDATTEGEAGEGDVTTDPDGDPATGDTGDDAGATDSDSSGSADAAIGEVKVLVLNGAGAKGIAARGSAVLQEAGFDVLAPRNANFLGPSKILYTDGFQLAAGEVADAYAVDASAVVEPFDPANPPINDTHGADIIVVVGDDGLIQV